MRLAWYRYLDFYYRAVDPRVNWFKAIASCIGLVLLLPFVGWLAIVVPIANYRSLPNDPLNPYCSGILFLVFIAVIAIVVDVFREKVDRVKKGVGRGNE